MEGLQDQTVPPASNNRALLAVVIILGVLIVLGVVGLVTAMVMGVVPRSAARLAEPYTTRLPAPAGAQITGAQIDGNRLLVHIDGAAVVVLEASTGRVLGRIELEPTP